MRIASALFASIVLGLVMMLFITWTNPGFGPLMSFWFISAAGIFLFILAIQPKD